jgi:hypothetical protein
MPEPVPQVRKQTTSFESEGFLWGLWFPPTIHYKPPNTHDRAGNVIVGAQTFYI